jgi:hypothetical protein
VLVGNADVIPPRPLESYMVKSSVESRLGSVKKLGILAQKNEISEETQSLLNGGLDGLRELALRREMSRQKVEQELRNDQQISERIARLQALLPLCDALRSAFISGNKTSMVLKDLLSLLSLQLFITKHEALTRINILSAVIPEFFQVIRADSMVPHTTVRVNFQVNFSSLRKKLQKYVEDSLSKSQS